MKEKSIELLNKAAAVNTLIQSIITASEKLYDFEKEQRRYVSAEAMGYIVRQMISIVNKFVSDDKIRTAISLEMKNIVVPEKLR